MEWRENIKNQKGYLGEVLIADYTCEVISVLKRVGLFRKIIKTFIIVGSIEDTITKDKISDFSKKCYQFAKQRRIKDENEIESDAIISIAILLGEKIDNDAKRFCEFFFKIRWAAFEVPVIYDIQHLKIFKYKFYPLWGIIFYPYISRTIHEAIDIIRRKRIM